MNKIKWPLLLAALVAPIFLLVKPPSKKIISDAEKHLSTPTETKAVKPIKLERQKPDYYPIKIPMWLKPFIEDNDQLLAKVAGAPIYFGDIRVKYYNTLSSYVQTNPGSPIPKEIAAIYRNQALSGTIQDFISLQECRALGLLPSQEMIDNKYIELKKNFPSEQHFQLFLDTRFINEHRYKEDLKLGYALRQYPKMLSDEYISKPNEQEIKDYFEQNKVVFSQPRKIKVEMVHFSNPSQNKKTGERQVKMLQSIRNQVIENKKPLSYFVKNFSDGVAISKEKVGGEWFKVSELNDSFKPLIKLPIGQISPIYSWDQGAYFARITDEEKAINPPFEDVKSQVAAKLMAIRSAKAMRDAKAALEQKYPIEVF